MACFRHAACKFRERELAASLVEVGRQFVVWKMKQASSMLLVHRNTRFQATGPQGLLGCRLRGYRGYRATCCKAFLHSLVAHKGPADMYIHNGRHYIL